MTSTPFIRALGRLAVLLLAAVAGSRAEAQRPSVEDMREGSHRERLEWFVNMRAYPFKRMPADKVAAMRELRGNVRAGAYASGSIGERWQPIGPSGFISMNTPYSSSPMTDEGRFTSVAINPQNPRNIVAGSGSAGVWRTVNGGASWQAVSDNECATSIGAITFDPVDPRIIYAGTGEIFDPSGLGLTDGCGILKSTNGGDSWTRVGTQLLSLGAQFGSVVYRMAVDRATAGTANATTVLAATSVGLLHSSDGGASWTRVLTGEVTDVVQHPTNPAVFYAAIGTFRGATENGVYRSSDRGFTWVRISGSLGTPTSLGRTTLAVSPARPTALWTLVANPQNEKFRSLSRWDDVTQSWVNLAANGVMFQSDFIDFGTQSSYNLVIGVDPDDENRVIIGGVRLFRSRDGGQNFQQIAANVHSDWHALAFDPTDPRRLVTGCDGGIFTSTNGGDTWRSLNNGITATQFYPGIQVHPTNPSIVVGGTQDNGSMMSNGALHWAGISYGDGGWAMMDYTNPNLLLTSSQNGNLQRHDLSTRSFQPLQPQYRFRPSFITPFIIDPLNPRTVYAGTLAIERSTDFGSNWAQMSPQFQSNVTAMAINRGSPQTMLIGTATGQVGLSRDGGVLWAIGTLVSRAVSDVAYDPNDPLRFLITWSGFSAPKVALSVNGGLNYTNISANLPDIPVNAVVFTPTRDRFFIGSDVGVWETVNGGQSWSLTQGLPSVPVTDLVYHAASNRIVAGTYGRGIWSLPLTTEPPVLRGDVDRNGIVNAADALLIQQALAQIRLPATFTSMPQGDANCSGGLDAADALIVLRFAVGLGTGGTCVNTAQ